MFQIDKTIVSDDILEKEFVCNLAKCKGECCVAGEAGAPVEEEETHQLRAIYEQIKPFLRPEGIAAIEEQGTHVTNDFGEHETPLVNGGECAYVVFDNNGIAGCGIEKAHAAGATHFKKPISCHLYPVRIQNFSQFVAVNYHVWQICNEACTLGKELGVPVYKFLKEALIRKFGEDWYAQLEKVAQEHEKRL